MISPSAVELADPETGKFGGLIPPGEVFMPGSIELDGDCLVWKYIPAAGKRHIKTYKPNGDVLTQFVKLWKNTVEDETIRPRMDRSTTPTQKKEKREAYKKVLEKQCPGAIKRTLQFANTYGVLLVHEGKLAPRWDAEGMELLTDWWCISRKAYAFMCIAADLNKNQLGSSEDWSVVNQNVYSKDPVPHLGGSRLHRVHLAWQMFQIEFGRWLELAGITFRLTSKLRKNASTPLCEWQMEIDYRGRLFSALVLQLLLTVLNADSLYSCSGCGWLYLRPRDQRRPNRNAGNFCSECGRREALRQASRRRREKMAEACRLHAEGFTVKRIAEELHTTAESVGNWLGKEK